MYFGEMYAGRRGVTPLVWNPLVFKLKWPNACEYIIHVLKLVRLRAAAVDSVAKAEMIDC